MACVDGVKNSIFEDLSLFVSHASMIWVQILFFITFSLKIEQKYLNDSFIFQADPEYLFSPIDGEAKFERAQLERHFPMNYTAFDPGRISRHGRFGRILIKAKDNGTLLRTRVFQQVGYQYLLI